MNIKKKVKKIIRKCLSYKKKIKNKHFFKTDLNADSLDMIEIIMSIEEKFSINISDKESSKINTIKNLIKLIKIKLIKKQ
ncbi:acyl carrier protein [Buchnera aphidicola (Periphyllus koelreuteriae)]|uniref:acyl carrier protein n=1 Tax=Buchnera aphidicola TaxID=9 RepID=UPI0031B8716A